METPAPVAAPTVVELEKQYLIQNYARLPVTLQRGKGCYLYDTQGKRYLDLISGIGVNALGYAHPRITKVLREQAGLLVHTSNLYYHEYQGPLAKRLCELSGMQRAFFGNSGTEVTEGAIKMMHAHGHRISPAKYEVIALEGSFHGRTMGSLSITGQPKYRKDFEPGMPGAKWVPIGDIAALEAAVNENTCGIIFELVQGEGGVNPVPMAFAKRARELADKFDALLCFDEIQCGLGRTGTHFAYQLAEPVIVPDIVVTAKPIASGVPLGAILANEKAAATLAAGMHGSTFGGGPLACRVALEFLDVLDEILPSITDLGAYFRRGLTDLARRYEFIREIRGYGLMIGVDMKMAGKQMVLDALEEGLLVNCTRDTVIRMLPPYVITEADIDRALEGLDKVFARQAARGEG